MSGAASAIQRQVDQNSVMPASRKFRKGNRYALTVEGHDAAKDWGEILRSVPMMLSLVRDLVDVVYLQEVERRRTNRAVRILAQGKIQIELEPKLERLVREIKKSAARIGEFSVTAEVVHQAQGKAYEQKSSTKTKANRQAFDTAIGANLKTILDDLAGLGFAARRASNELNGSGRSSREQRYAQTALAESLRVVATGKGIQMLPKAAPEKSRATGSAENVSWIKSYRFQILCASTILLVVLDRVLTLFLPGYP